ncbi:MAG: hypothetical protein J6X05_08340 [Bacteroidales bacterium]|nr:hypothetical protein [Bacteroidales bacterium]
MKKILFILLAGLLFYSCSKEDSGTEVDRTEHFVCESTANYMDMYYIPCNLELEYSIVSPGKDAILADMSVWRVDNENIKYYCCFASCPDSIRLPYYNYANYYGDTTYWGQHTMVAKGHGSIMPLKTISVVADRNYDENHPAGTLLNDLLSISYPHNYSYISNKYAPSRLGSDYMLDSISPLSSFKGDFLFPDRFKLIFQNHPSVHGKYTFTVTLTFDKDPVSGESLELAPASIEIEF